MSAPMSHVLVADVGGTHTGVAIFANHGADRLIPVRHSTFRTRRIGNIPEFLGKYLAQEARSLRPAVGRACIDFAGPIDPARDRASMTNLPYAFTAEEIRRSTGTEKVTLLNDFEAVGFGLEVLVANHPEAFVRLSRSGRLPVRGRSGKTLLVMGAGTGLGTTVLVFNPGTQRFHPVPGEGGHVDFQAVEEQEFRIAQWIRKHRNDDAGNPLNRERIVSGPGLANVHEALADLEPGLGYPAVRRAVLGAKSQDRPALIAEHAPGDPLCRLALDTWLRCYGRAARNCAIFPLSPGGVFLAGGIAAKIISEMKSGVFMREFYRCDIPNIRAILKKIPVFVITDYRIGLFGCASVAANDLI